MHIATRKRQGFSLVELVVVVLVMGIIAAVAGPKMFDTAGDARESGTRQSLAVLRDAIELYKAKNGEYPGETNDTEAEFKAEIGTFLRGAFPECELVSANKDTVTVVTAGTDLSTAGAGAGGWRYDSTTGQIVIDDTNYDDL